MILALISTSAFSQFTRSLHKFRVTEWAFKKDGEWSSKKVDCQINIDLTGETYFEGHVGHAEIRYNWEDFTMYFLTNYYGKKVTDEGEFYTWSFINMEKIEGMFQIKKKKDGTYVLAIFFNDRDDFAMNYIMNPIKQ